MKIEFLRLNYTPCPPDEAPERFGFECPRRPGHMCTGLLIRTAELAAKLAIAGPSGWRRPASWQWNGDRDRPTFNPSIDCLTRREDGEECAGCGWHGFITDGEAHNA